MSISNKKQVLFITKYIYFLYWPFFSFEQNAHNFNIVSDSVSYIVSKKFLKSRTNVNRETSVVYRKFVFNQLFKAMLFTLIRIFQYPKTAELKELFSLT